ncbi:hypothetical protein [Propionibacterium australiense]|uniref:Apolipoprotein n=1 Tax=Propionibacterium australiense TaxID=119981 RepID=A0A383S4C0_9ACTN|nr:hypothetical protein [Propionibacterium australiense]RLP10662.1 hypothetical protein D9T14_05300 [Propionibacterium australiense]RLP12957.1 hypothetical protein D7U36_00545 [Propionibacterium australiense]SYZ32868.1 Apolipoprotein [Propionibacterium australiense]VEH91083.1 Uncharacterised protein [Propionibacterium australiense]
MGASDSAQEATGPRRMSSLFSHGRRAAARSGELAGECARVVREKGGAFASSAAARLDKGLDAAVDNGAAAFNRARRRSGEAIDRIDAWSVRVGRKATHISDQVVDASSDLGERISERAERLGRRIQDAVEETGQGEDRAG